MKTLACSSIVGFKSHLDTLEVRLPLKYNEGKDLELSAHEQFNQHLSSKGDIIDFTGHKSFIDTVTVDLLNDHKTLDLTPLVINNKLDVSFQRISIKLPNKIVSPNCFSITIQENANDDLNLVVDLIDSNYLFITVVVNIKNFIANNNDGFNLNNFKNWGNISVPYSFELTANPFFIKSTDYKNCLVSLADGTLLHFSRSTPLEDFDVFNFTENTSRGFSLLNGFFNKGTTSTNSILDIIVIDDLLFALTAKKVLKLYSLSTHTFLETIPFDDTDTTLGVIPNKYLFPVRTYDKTYIVAHVSGSFEADKPVDFHIWEVNDLHNIKKEVFQVGLPEFDESFRNKTWFIQDFFVENLSTEFKLSVLWKSNFSSLLMNYFIDHETISINDIQESKLGNNSEDLLQVFDQSYYEFKVSKSGEYDPLIVQTSVNILRERLGLPKALKNEVLIHQTVHEYLQKEVSSNPWFMLNSLCEEYKKLSHEALNVTLVADYIIVLQSNGLGLYRNSSSFESFVDDSSDELNQVLKTLRVKLSSKSFNKAQKYLNDLDEICSKDLVYISDSILSTKLTDEIPRISEILNNYPNIMEKLKELIEGDPVENIGYEGSLTTLCKVFHVVSFRNIAEVHRHLLLELVILFSKFDDEEVIIELCNSILKKLQNFKLFDILFSGEYENSLIWSQLIVKGTISNKYNYLHEKVSDQNYLINIVTGLIKSNASKSVLDEFVSKINHNQHKFIIGLVYFINKDIKSVDLLTYDNFRKLNRSDFDFNDQLNTFFSNDNSSESKFYHNLSTLISKIPEEPFIRKAIESELKAVELEEDYLVEEVYYQNVFNLAIKLVDVEQSWYALTKLSGTSEFTSSVRLFINKLIQLKKFNHLLKLEDIEAQNFLNRNFSLIDSILNELANSEPLLTSIQYYQLIYSWRITYRLKRDAMQSLYTFITRFQEEERSLNLQDTKLLYLKILEYYLMILNCLKSFQSENERWILKSGPGAGPTAKILTVRDLSIEYQRNLEKLNAL